MAYYCRATARRRALGDASLVLDQSSLQNNPTLTTDTSIWTNASNPLDISGWLSPAPPQQIASSSSGIPNPLSAAGIGNTLNATGNTVENAVGLGVGTGSSSTPWVAYGLVGLLTLILIMKR